TTSRSPNFLCNAFSSGIAFRQGPHQVAQKSINTNLPFRSGSCVSHFSTTSGGAFWFRKDFAPICFSPPNAAHEASTETQTSNNFSFIFSFVVLAHPNLPQNLPRESVRHQEQLPVLQFPKAAQPSLGGSLCGRFWSAPRRMVRLVAS